MDEIIVLLEKVRTIIKHNEQFSEVVNDRFNMFKICGVNHYENTHSAIISELLKIDGSHGFKEKFIKAFIQTLKNESIIDNQFDFLYSNLKVYTEYVISDGRIDILITDDNQAIIIENKIYASDQFEQLKRYSKFGQIKYNSNYQLLYLTLWGNEATEFSGKDVAYKQISFSETIIKWLDQCVELSARNATVRETLIQYINHLKTLTGQDMNTLSDKELIELLCKPENISAVFTIGNNLSVVKNQIINKIFLSQLSKICEELDLTYLSEEYDRVNTSYSGFAIKNPKWKYFKIGTEFEAKGLRNFIIGINHIDGQNRNDVTFEELKRRFKGKSNSNWIWHDFPHFGNWDKDAMIAIISGRMAEIFKVEIQKILENTDGLDM
jgi:hypothetical protein